MASGWALTLPSERLHPSSPQILCMALASPLLHPGLSSQPEELLDPFSVALNSQDPAHLGGLLTSQTGQAGRALNVHPCLRQRHCHPNPSIQVPI